MSLEKQLDKQFWDTRWQQAETGWDIGYAAPALTDVIDQYPNREAAVLIPGCGNAYEAEYLVQQGYANITLIDIAPAAVKRLQQKFAKTPQVKVICADFFTHEGHYDLILEQTFFCALSPALREDYVNKMASLLVPGGRLCGLLFSRNFEQEGPPFGGTVSLYESLFSRRLDMVRLEPCTRSIPQRAGSELFFEYIKARNV
ncbi:MAG: methyltransferase domain-containing protein [Chitinophagales bacterium]